MLRARKKMIFRIGKSFCYEILLYHNSGLDFGVHDSMPYLYLINSKELIKTTSSETKPLSLDKIKSQSTFLAIMY